MAHLQIRGIPTPHSLYCSEVIDDDDSIKQVSHLANDSPFDHDESSISNAFDSEVDQMLGPDLLVHYRSIPGVSFERQNAVNWMFKVHAYYQFQPVTAYLSAIYLDRFLSSHTLPRGKGWSLQLLSVACLALAAKMEEACVPSLLDLQVFQPRFLFKAKTIQRMELLVMASFKWRLRAITPFDFVHYFLTKVPCFGPPHDHLTYVSSHVSDLILSTRRVIDFLDYPPSVIAATAVLWVTGQSVDDVNLGCLHKRVSRGMVKKCHNLVKQKKYQLSRIEQPKQEATTIDAAAGWCDAKKSSNKDLQASQDSLTNKC